MINLLCDMHTITQEVDTMAKIITIAISKGGTAKSTTAAALLQAGAQAGAKTLAIDLDPQANLTHLTGGTQNEGSYLFLRGAKPKDVIQHTAQGIDLIAASRALATEKSEKGSATRLRKAIQPIKRAYDLIIIDTPPTASELLYNALQAATGLIIPLQAGILDLQGLTQIAETAALIQQSNPDLSVLGVLITRYSGRTNLSKQLKEIIADAAANMQIPYLQEIREGIAVQEAAAMRVSLFKHAPKSKPAIDYMALYNKIMEV